MHKRLFAMVLAFCLCFHVPAYAQATPSDASRSDALKVGLALDADPWYSLDVGLADDLGIMPLVDGLYGQDWVYGATWVSKVDGKNLFRHIKKSDGRYLVENPDPNTYTFFNQFSADLHKSTIPAPGTYNLKWRMNSANAYPDITSLAVEYCIVKANTEPVYTRVNHVGFTTHNTYWDGNFNITIPANCSSVALIFFTRTPADQVKPFDLGEFKVNFIRFRIPGLLITFHPLPLHLPLLSRIYLILLILYPAL